MFSELGLAKIPLPEITDQVPIPTIAVFANKLIDELHCVESLPAIAKLGGASKLIIIVSLEVAHVPLEMLHSKIFCPIARPFTFVEEEFGIEKIPAPEIKFQVPIPISGLFANKFNEVAH